MRVRILAFLLTLTITTTVYAQSIEMGLRDNQYARANYHSAKGWIAGYEQSLLNARLKEQSGRLFTGYEFKRDNWKVKAVAYCGSEYTGIWQVYGAWMEGAYQLHGIYFDAIINPNYDTGFDFSFCYQAEVGVSLWKKQENNQKVEICASYGNIPEYRKAVNNFQGGLKFTSNNLWVKPMVFIPLANNDCGQTYFRVLCSFGWCFDL